MKVLLVATLLLAEPAVAQSRSADPLAYTQLSDPAAEARARGLMDALRCVVCQGQSIADSDAGTAADMRALVRQRIAAGESPTAVRRWLIARYGDYVTYDPPLSGVTWPLYLAPLALLAMGVAVARASFRRRR